MLEQVDDVAALSVRSDDPQVNHAGIVGVGRGDGERTVCVV
jgi:hypothetical protein